jgi:CheY-like chemotaxis protein
VLYFPWHAAAQAAPAAAASAGRAAAAGNGAAAEFGAASGSGRRILVIDDQEDVRRLTAQLLRRQGYVVVEAAGGPDALELLIALHETGDGGLPVDALVTDISMPEMTGTDLVRQLRGFFPDLPVLFISGHMHPEDHGISTAEPDTAFLHKPFEPAELARAVAGVLRRPRSEPA